MPFFTKESLETLRQRINLIDVLSSHLELKHSGASYKALCPFHDEKTPSFTVQKGDTHYHCFGCGAHGDAIEFLMNYQKMSFLDAIESLAQRFQVTLEEESLSDKKKGPSKSLLKEALECACRFYHFLLLHTPEGHLALDYLYQRGLDLDFIQDFHIGLSPSSHSLLRKVLHAKFIKDETMVEAGLIQEKMGTFRDFFTDRITFPIRDVTGAVIGFSARKYKEETFGGKYINTPETPLFKKSQVLFGLNYCRRRIAKERRTIIVEGQIDALRLIQLGFNITVAGQGTAFGEGHVKELMTLGINQAFLALDSDTAGFEATFKIGNLFQKEGVGVQVVQLPPKSDPDSFLKQQGTQAFLKLLENSIDYLTFLVHYQSHRVDINSPAGKNELVQEIAKQIRGWNQPVMAYDSLKKLAQLTQTPEEMIGIGQNFTPNIYIKKSGSIGLQQIDPDRIMESDVLRWLLMGGGSTRLTEIIQINLKPENLRTPLCRRIYEMYLAHYSQKPCNLLSLMIYLEDAESQQFITELEQKKVNRERAEQHCVEAVQKILDRNWMESREEIKRKIQSGECSDEEASNLLKHFDEIKKHPPKIKLP